MPRRRCKTTASRTLLALLFTACAASEPTGSLVQTLRIEGAQDKWRAASLSNYSFNSTVYCFCLDEFVGTKRVTVRAGQVTAVVDVRSGVQNPSSWRQPIDSLFALARREALTLPALLELSFDSRLGFPRRISYGEQALDGGGVIIIDSLRADP